MNFFLKEGSLVAYSGESVNFLGPIYHDMVTCEAGRAVVSGWLRCLVKHLNFEKTEIEHLNLLEL